MHLLALLTGTLVAGVGSVWIAAVLSFGMLARYTQHMLSLAAGALLATAFVELVPEAFESGVELHVLSTTLLAGLLFFFLLDKAELWHHGHEHHPDLPTLDQAMAQGRGHAAPDAPGGQHHHGGSWAVLVGDVVHCWGDGVLIAAAFAADLQLGWMAALAVLVHEVPHHMGDLVVLRRSQASSRRLALIKVSLAGTATMVGGLSGFVLVAQLGGLLPYLLVVAASSFIYVALADLIPQLQKHLDTRQTLAQIVWLVIGMGMVIAVAELALLHGH